MSDDESYELLGFDNVVMPVGRLADAVAFYERAGFTVGFRFDEGGIALLKVGGETPGILLRAEEGLGHRPAVWASPRVWLEVPDAPGAGRPGHGGPGARRGAPRAGGPRPRAVWQRGCWRPAAGGGAGAGALCGGG
ncbi:hypothetical protein ACFV23_20980, partial [Streptomyces sp. NPDC059627]